MTQMSAEPVDGGTPSKQILERAALEIQHDRGIIYVYGSDGTPLLKITGLPKPIPELITQGHIRPLTVEIHEQGAVCSWGPTPTVVTPGNPIPHPLEHDPWRNERNDTAVILKRAGATISEGGERTT